MLTSCEPYFCSHANHSTRRASVAEIQRHCANRPLLFCPDAYFPVLCRALLQRSETDVGTGRLRGLGGISTAVFVESCLLPSSRQPQVMMAHDTDFVLAVFSHALTTEW